jgi:hypothetical protein
MKTIYLAGPISGRPEKEYTLHFYKAADEIRRRIQMEELENDVTLFNPVPYCKIQVDPGAPWHACMRHCLSRLALCDGIGLLQGWRGSIGARFELHIAVRLNIPVVYVEPPVRREDIMTQFPIDLTRYYQLRYLQGIQDGFSEDFAEDRALTETVHRYLDPHGFEYLNEPGADGPRSETSKEENHGTV